MPQINLSETKSSVVKVPPNFSDTVTLRVKKYSFGKSNSSGRDQITLETEIVAPDKYTIDSVEYVLAGQEITFYCGIGDEKVGKAKSSPLAQLKEFHQKVGLPMEIDTDNLPYEGLLFEFWLKSYDKPLQRREGKEYITLLDENGKPRTLGYQWSNQLENVLGPSSLDVNAAF